MNKLKYKIINKINIPNKRAKTFKEYTLVYV